MARTALLLGALANTLCFVTWTLLAPLAPGFQAEYGLTNTQISMVIAAPVLLGSLGRIPAGALSDRFGGRRVFAGLLAIQVIPLLLMGLTRSYTSLLAVALLIGIAGTGFAVGIPLVSRWFPPEKQGLVLGIYGAGNIGTAIAALLSPRIAAAFGWPWVFWSFIPVVLALAAVVWLFVRDVPKPEGWKPASITEALRQPLAWLLSFWYFITFGGFVAFGGYLVKLYTDLYGLDRAAAGTWASFFVIGATVVRPLGGMLADRIGGKQATAISLIGIASLASVLTLALPLEPFRLVILGLGAFFGLGNGAIFKLVPQYFPKQTGVVTGLVGALGGLGGFFPPLVMGLLRDRLGTYTPAFAMLAATAAVGWLLIGLLAEKPAPWKRPKEEAALRQIEAKFASRAAMNGFIVTGLLLFLIYIGTDALHHFDPALYGYAVATIVAVLGITIRLTAWLMRPATRTLAARLVRNLFRRVERKPNVKNPVPEGVGRWFEGRNHPGGYVAAGKNQRNFTPATKGGDPGIKPEAQEEHAIPGRPGPAVAAGTLVNNILLNRFIFRRSLWRGLQHFLLMWGIFGSFAITVPLVFGWLHFEAIGETHYRVIFFELPLWTMPVHGLLAGLIYHGLSTFAVITLVGISMVIIRRLTDKDAKVDQRAEYDMFPLWLILAVTVTGLGLTVSHGWAGGWGYPSISVIHQITVVFLLLYLPFGKLFHIPMRGLSIGTEVYHEVEAHEGLLACARCAKTYATKAQIQDVIAVLKESGQTLLAADGKTHLAEYCPECRRVIRGLLYSRRPLHPHEQGARQPLTAPGISQGGPTLEA